MGTRPARGIWHLLRWGNMLKFIVALCLYTVYHRLRLSTSLCVVQMIGYSFVLIPITLNLCPFHGSPLGHPECPVQQESLGPHQDDHVGEL